MFAVIRTKGYQFLVRKGERIKIPVRMANVGTRVVFDQVLLVKDNSATVVGQPYVEGAKVKGIVRETGKSSKVIVYKFKRRKKYRRKRGHRQDFCEVEILDIEKGK